MGSNTSKKAKITEAIAWMETNKPELFRTITDKFIDIIEADDKLGEENVEGDMTIPTENDSGIARNPEMLLLKRKAEFMLITIAEIEPVLQTSLIAASRLTARAKNWSFIGWVVTTVFSISTLTALNIPDFVDKAQWSAAGGTLSSMAVFMSDHLTKVSDGEIKLSAIDARNRLIDLRYELKEGRSELQLRLEYPDDKEKLEQAILRMNNACKQVNQISGLLDSLTVQPA